MKYVKVEDRVRMTGIRRRREISVIVCGDGSREADWDSVIWPNRTGHEADVESTDAIRDAIQHACEDVRELCAKEALRRVGRLLWYSYGEQECRYDRVDAESRAVANAIRSIEL